MEDTPGLELIGLDALFADFGTSLNASSKFRLSNAIFKEVIQTSDFARLHTIQTGVEHNDSLLMVEKTKQWGFLKKSSTVGCAYNECSIVDNITGKVWNPHKYDCEIKFCPTDAKFTADWRTFWGINCAQFQNDIENTFIAYLKVRISELINDSHWRIGYFDYKTNPDTAYAGIDGFFVQWQAVATPANKKQRVVITENAATTIAAQLTLPADAAYNYYKSMYDKMMLNRSVMTSKAGLRIETTRALATNYLHYLQNTREINCCYNMMHDGTTSSGYSYENLNYMGIPIIIINEWDEIIQNFLPKITTGSDIAYNKPHRAVLTYDANRVIGTCDLNALKIFKVIFDPISENLIMRVSSSLDAQIPIDSDFILAI
jgi:hypothetical protein